MKKAAQEKLTKIEREQKQSYITEETWNLIKERQKSREDGDFMKEDALTKEIKKKADRDKLNYELDQFNEYAGQREKWIGIKFSKKIHTPNFTKLKDIRGNRVPHGQRAEASAEYLEKTCGITKTRLHRRSTRQKSYMKILA